MDENVAPIWGGKAAATKASQTSLAATDLMRNALDPLFKRLFHGLFGE